MIASHQSTPRQTRTKLRVVAKLEVAESRRDKLKAEAISQRTRTRAVHDELTALLAAWTRYLEVLDDPKSTEVGWSDAWRDVVVCIDRLNRAQGVVG
jgi:hypothetical protein